jgi:hypothetical protein
MTLMMVTVILDFIKVSLVGLGATRMKDIGELYGICDLAITLRSILILAA